MKTTLRLLAAACLYVTTAFAQNQLTANLTVTNQEIVGAAAGSIPVTVFEVDSTSTSSPRGIMSAQFNSGTDGARFHGRKARGTRAAPTTVVTGDNLTRWVGSGYDGSNFLEDASIIFGTEGTVAATRIPTNIQFWTATNAAPSVLTLAGQFNSSQQLVLINGAAATPSLCLGGTNQGWYASGTGVALASGGAFALAFDSNGSILGAQSSSQKIQLPTTGAITVTAGGTNQSIALTPSGTGGINIGSTVSASTTTPLYTSLGGTYGTSLNNGWKVKMYDDASTIYGFGVNASLLYFGSNVAANAVSVVQGTTRVATFAATTGNLLLGGLTTDGTGVLQFPAAANAAGGITLGDINLYRSAATSLQTNATSLTLGSNPSLNFPGAGVISANSGGTLTFQTGTNTTALTLSATQLATFGSDIRVPSGHDIGLSSNDRMFFSAGSNVLVVGGVSVWSVNSYGAGSSLAVLTPGTVTNNSGTQAVLAITPTYNQSAGTAANTDLLINRTQTAVGSGAQLLIDAQVSTVSKFSVTNTGNLAYAGSLSGDNGTLTTNGSGLINKYGGINTAGNGIVSIQGAGRQPAQTGSVTAATYTVGGADASFEVSANILVTTATTHAFTCTCAYTDEGNTARTITFTFSNVGGTFLTSIANTGGTVPYEGVPLHIRAKAATTITIATTGTFTSVVYNVEGVIRKLQ